MQTQYHIEIDRHRQTITYQITPRVNVVVDLVHSTRTLVKDGAALDTCQIEPDILQYYQWLLRVADDAELLNANTQTYG